MVRVGEVLYFSPKFRFSDIDFRDYRTVIKAFRDRIEGFYLKPAGHLIQAGHAFAAGLVCAACIDSLSRLSLSEGGNIRITHWLERNIPAFKTRDPEHPTKTLADRFTDYFRNGLVHEGRIKSLGQFSSETQETVQVIGSAMVVNPGLLLHEVCRSFDEYCSLLDREPPAAEKLAKKG
jgi:hypothetical protein